MNTEYHNIILYLIQIVSIYNAIIIGWNVRKIGINKYELSTKNNNIADFGLREIIETIVTFNIIGTHV